MYSLIGVIAIFIVAAMASMLFEMLRTPPGIERKHHVERHRIFSRTSAVTDATPAEAIRLLQTDWSWWHRARAEPMRDLGDGRTEFVFHPVRFLDLIEVPPAFVVRLEPTETLPDGGQRIPATLTGDFDGRAEYTARPGPGGTIVELAWCGAEVRSVMKNAPIALVAAVHCWRERIGVQGLRARLRARPGR